MTSTTWTAAAAMALTLLVAGCSAETGPQSSADRGTEADSDGGASVFPDCSEVWVAGNELPVDYRGCLDEDGTEVTPDVINCGTIGEEFATFDDSYFGFLGGEVGEGSSESDAYAEAYGECTDN
ncbi:hypothetical protein [Nocardioides lentus]